MKNKIFCGLEDSSGLYPKEKIVMQGAVADICDPEQDGRRLRRMHRTGSPRPQGCVNHYDLYSCSEPGGTGMKSPADALGETTRQCMVMRKP